MALDPTSAPPLLFSLASLACIPKKEPEDDPDHGPCIHCQDTRPISVFTRCYRLMTAFYVDIFRHQALKTCHPSQSGFLTECIENIVILDNCLYDFHYKKRHGGALSTDIKAAFPSPHWSYITAIFHEMQAPPWVHTLFYNVFCRVEHCMFSRSGLIFGARVARGLPQGNAISAFLFLLVINPLVEKIHTYIKPWRGERCRAFADDLCTALESPHRIPGLLAIYDQFAHVSLCKLNYKKTKWIYVYPPTPEELRWAGDHPQWSQVETVRSHILLGIIIGVGISPTERTAKQLRKFLQTWGRWKQVSHGPVMRNTLCQTYCLPIFSYVFSD